MEQNVNLPAITTGKFKVSFMAFSYIAFTIQSYHHSLAWCCIIY